MGFRAKQNCADTLDHNSVLNSLDRYSRSFMERVTSKRTLRKTLRPRRSREIGRKTAKVHRLCRKTPTTLSKRLPNSSSFVWEAPGWRICAAWQGTMGLRCRHHIRNAARSRGFPMKSRQPFRELSSLRWTAVLLSVQPVDVHSSQARRIEREPRLADRAIQSRLQQF